MVKLSEKVLARQTVREDLGKLDLWDSAEFKLSDLVERYGADAMLSFGYDYCYGDDERETEVNVYRLVKETDEDYKARIETEQKRQDSAAKAREERKKREAELARKRAIEAERAEKALYLKLRKKYENE